METEHTEGVIEKAVAYVKDMFGAPPYHRHVDSEGRPIIPATPTETELTSKDAMAARSGRVYHENRRGGQRRKRTTE